MKITERLTTRAYVTVALIDHYASEIREKGWDLEDLVQDCVLELLTHRAKWDPERGSQSTFVRLVIRRVVQRWRRDRWCDGNRRLSVYCR